MLILVALECVRVGCLEVRARMALALIADERWLLHRLNHHRLLLLLLLVLYDDCILEAHVDRVAVHGLLHHLLLFHST